MKKIALAILLSLSLVPAASFAQVVIRMAPPPPVVERRPPPPGRHGYMWIDGYQRWDGRAYAWVPGRWERPPHPGQRWYSHQWQKKTWAVGFRQRILALSCTTRWTTNNGVSKNPSTGS